MKQTVQQKPQQEPETARPNLTGIPTQMKRDFEARSGLSFDDVRVHYNSDKPAQLQALAYTQGTQVHVGPGQERHLPHELGHVVQQKYGIVPVSGRISGYHVNTDSALEHMADTAQFPYQTDQNSLAIRSDNVIQRLAMKKYATTDELRSNYEERYLLNNINLYGGEWEFEAVSADEPHKFFFKISRLKDAIKTQADNIVNYGIKVNNLILENSIQTDSILLLGLEATKSQANLGADYFVLALKIAQFDEDTRAKLINPKKAKDKSDKRFDVLPKMENWPLQSEQYTKQDRNRLSGLYRIMNGQVKSSRYQCANIQKNVNKYLHELDSCNYIHNVTSTDEKLHCDVSSGFKPTAPCVAQLSVGKHAVVTRSNHNFGKMPKKISALVAQNIMNMSLADYANYALMTKGAASHAEIRAANAFAIYQKLELFKDKKATLKIMKVPIQKEKDGHPQTQYPSFPMCPHCAAVLGSENIKIFIEIVGDQGEPQQLRYNASTKKGASQKKFIRTQKMKEEKKPKKITTAH